MLHRHALSLLVLLLPLATSGCLLPYAVPAIPNPATVEEPAPYSLTREMWRAIGDSSKPDPNALPQRIVGAELLPEGQLVVACEWSDGSTRIHSGPDETAAWSWYEEATLTREPPPACEEVEGGVRLPGATSIRDPGRVQPGDVLSLHSNALRVSRAGGPVEFCALTGYDERRRTPPALDVLGVLGTPLTLCADATMLSVSLVTFAVLLPPSFLLDWLD